MKKVIITIVLLLVVTSGVVIALQSSSSNANSSEKKILPSWELFAKLNLKNVAGNTVSLPNIKERKGLIFFFNPECESCIIKLYELKHLENAFQDWEVVLIASDKRQQAVKELIHKVGLDQQPYISTLLVNENEMMKNYKVEGVPQVITYDEQGQPINTFVEEKIDFEQIIKSMGIAENPQ